MQHLSGSILGKADCKRASTKPPYLGFSPRVTAVVRSQRAGEQIQVAVYHIVIEPTVSSNKNGIGDGGCCMDGNP